MGKRRRHRSRDSFWRQQYGGMPAWGIGAAIAVIALLAGVAIVNMPQQVRASASQTLRPPAPMATPTTDPRPTVAFLGDSYTFGTGRTAKSENRWTSFVSRDLGWREQRFAVGGTGYVQGEDYGTRVDKVIASKPDVVVVSGGRNDVRVLDEVEAAATQVFERLKTGLPDAKIIVLNPWWDDDAAPSGLAGVTAAVAAAAETAQVEFVDVGQPLEGHPEFLSEDGVHPNDDGYRAIADAVEPALSPLVASAS